MRKVDKEFLKGVDKRKISELGLNTVGRLNQKRVAEFYRSQGHVVLDVNEEGFPDLIIVLDKKIFSNLLFVEVKGGEHSVHWSQSKKLFELSRFGSKVKIGHVLDHLDENKWRIVEKEPPLQETLVTESKQDKRTTP